MNRLLVNAVGCLLLCGCAWTDSGDSDESPAARPVAQLIAYTRHGANGDAEVWVARVDGRSGRRLADGTTPKISPDGRWVAFQGGREGAFEAGFYRDVMLIATSGGQPRLLMPAADRPVWSPDSKRVAVLQGLDGRRRALLSIDIETEQRTTIARGAIVDVDVSFSPRGDQVAYTRGEVFGKVDVYVAATDGDGEHRLTTDEQSAYPVWGPREIAVARIVPYRGWGAHEIWLVRPDGSGRRLLTKTPRGLLGQGITGLIPVAWSADGRVLAAALSNEFGGPPYAVDPATGAVRRIGDYGYRSWPDGLSRDGRFILVSQSGVNYDEQSVVEVIGRAGGSRRIIARRASGASWNR